jgi:hypothetical protein
MVAHPSQELSPPANPVRFTQTDTDYLNDSEVLAQECLWFIPFKGLCIFIEKPTTVSVEPAGPEERVRLHCADGPALAFGDGWRVQCWHGLRIPPDLIEKRHKLTPKQIALVPNAEIRRAAIEIYGVARYMPDAGGRVIHRDAYGTLWRRDLGPDDEPYCAVEVLNGSLEPDGSRKTYFLSVPRSTVLMPDRRDDGRPIDTALDAVAWTDGLRGDEYQALRVRT